MKSKRLVVFLIILAFLTVLIVLNSTVFTLQKVSLNWLTTKDEMIGIKDNSIIDVVSTGENIFLVDKANIISDLEKEFPYLRVVGVETKFPNKLVIHTAERENLFAINMSDGNGNKYYMILDEKGKVLRKTTSSIFAGEELGAKPIKVSFVGSNVNPDDYVVGEEVKEGNVRDLLQRLSYTMREAGHTPTTCKGVFTDISIVYAGNEKEINFSTRNGMVISLKDAEYLTTEKLLLGLTVYDSHQQHGVVEGTIDVWYNLVENKIMARYS
ncbi:MAG: FtsQ-type POTRA domain-containing protein [Clostridiales bacterium]|nr:FtsQ-type POTRA domain-containing protein [Clostridiales bacterium]